MINHLLRTRRQTDCFDVSNACDNRRWLQTNQPNVGTSTKPIEIWMHESFLNCDVLNRRVVIVTREGIVWIVTIFCCWNCVLAEANGNPFEKMKTCQTIWQCEAQIELTISNPEPQCNGPQSKRASSKLVNLRTWTQVLHQALVYTAKVPSKETVQQKLSSLPLSDRREFSHIVSRLWDEDFYE